MTKEKKPEKIHAKINKKYTQPTISKRIEAFFLDNLNKVITRKQLLEVAKDPKTGREPENWHQRLSELRTDKGYTILSHRDRDWLSLGEYMISDVTRVSRTKRITIDQHAWKKVLQRSGKSCEWNEGNYTCGLKEGEIDPVGGGTVKLTPDHKTPHSFGKTINSKNLNEWQVLCGRHQVVKKNYWDNVTGKLNIHAILQSATEKEKRNAFEFLKNYFKE